jgi:hypothetical protein
MRRLQRWQVTRPAATAGARAERKMRCGLPYRERRLLMNHGGNRSSTGIARDHDVRGGITNGWGLVVRSIPKKWVFAGTLCVVILGALARVHREVKRQRPFDRIVHERARKLERRAHRRVNPAPDPHNRPASRESDALGSDRRHRNPAPATAAPSTATRSNESSALLPRRSPSACAAADGCRASPASRLSRCRGHHRCCNSSAIPGETRDGAGSRGITPDAPRGLCEPRRFLCLLGGSERLGCPLDGLNRLVD